MNLKFDFINYFSRKSSPQKPPKTPDITVLHQFCTLVNCGQNHPQFGTVTGEYTAGPCIQSEFDFSHCCLYGSIPCYFPIFLLTQCCFTFSLHRNRNNQLDKCTICIVDALSTPAGTWRNTLACVWCVGTLGRPGRKLPGHC